MRGKGYRILRFWNNDVPELMDVWRRCTRRWSAPHRSAVVWGLGDWPPTDQPSPDGSASATPPQGGSDWTSNAPSLSDSMDPNIGSCSRTLCGLRTRPIPAMVGIRRSRRRSRTSQRWYAQDISNPILEWKYPLVYGEGCSFLKRRVCWKPLGVLPRQGLRTARQKYFLHKQPLSLRGELSEGWLV